MPSAKQPGTRQPRGKPRGLPSALVRTVPAEDDATVRDVLVRCLRAGNAIEVAAAKAHVAKSTVYDWLLEAARIGAQVEAGRVKSADLSPIEAAIYEFGQAAAYASHSVEADAVENIGLLARGGAKRRRTTTTYRVGKGGDEEVVRVEMEEELPPERESNVFLLERRTPERWNRRQQIEITAGDTDPESVPESPLPGLVAMLEAMEARTRETGQALADG